MNHFSWARPGESIVSSRVLENRDLYQLSDPISVITLVRLEDDHVEKLKELVRTSPLRKLLLRDCFRDASKLKEVLEALVENDKISKMVLQLRDNACDVNCIEEIKKLIARKVIKSLVLPQGLGEFLLAEVLQAIFEKRSELGQLDISGSVINDNSIELLKNIIQSNLIRGKLVMTGCEGVANTTLTTHHKEILEEAVKRASRQSLISSRIHVDWFTHVLHAKGLEAENDDDYEVCEVEEVVLPVFGGKIGKYEQVIRLLIRNKKGGPWQHLRSFRKRSRDSQISDAPHKRVTKPKVKDSEIDSLSEQMGPKSSAEEELSHPNTQSLLVPMISTGLSDKEKKTKGASQLAREPVYLLDELTQKNQKDGPVWRRRSLLTSEYFSTFQTTEKPKDIAGYAIYEKKSIIKVCLWLSPDGGEARFLQQLEHNDYNLINTSEFKPSYLNKKADIVTLSVILPYPKELKPSEKVNMKRLADKQYMEIDYTIPEVFEDSDMVEIAYTIAKERGRFRID